MGVINGNARSLDYGSFDSGFRLRGPGPGFRVSGIVWGFLGSGA